MRPHRRHSWTALAMAALAVLATLAWAMTRPSGHHRHGDAYGLHDLQRCTQTVNPRQTAAEVDSAIKEAAGGESICMEGGTYAGPFVMLGGRGESGRRSYVTIRPAEGANVVISGKLEVRNTSYERYENLHFTTPVSLNDGPTYKGSHDYQLLDDTWENAGAGVALEGGKPSQDGGFMKKVLIERGYFYNTALEAHGVGHGSECKAGVDGQMLTVGVNVEGVTVRHSTFYEAQWHYIQGASHGPEGMLVENNLFMGYVPWECAHLNVWQIYQGGENNTFRNNIIRGKGTKELSNGGHEEASVDWLQFENGAAASECGVHLMNTVVENNLVVDGNNAQIWTAEGLTVRHNTVVGESRNGALSLLTTHCGPGRNYTMTHNLGVGGSLVWGESIRGDVFDYNATTNTSAEGHSAAHYVVDWTPRWVTTAWNPFKEVEQGDHFPKPPPGYYIPEGLSIEAGYRGGGGV